MAFITDDILVEGSISGSSIFLSGTNLSTTIDNINSNATRIITGGTFNNSTDTITFVNNTGGTFTVTGITDTIVTGGTYAAGTLSLTNNTGGTINVTGFSFGAEVFVTGGTYSNGTAVFTNNTGGTFNVTGFVSGDSFTTAFTYSNNTFSINRNQGLPTLTASINSVTGLTSTGALTSSSVSATTVSSSTLTVSGVTFNKLLREKSGIAAGASFAGNPKTFTVTFGTSFPSANYSIQIAGPVARSWTYQSQTASGFVINANVNGAFVGNVSWFCKEVGEV